MHGGNQNMENDSESDISSLGTQDSCYTLPKSERILNITVATTAKGWNIVANEQLTIELAKNPRLKVYGLVPRNTQEQRLEAKKSNIELVDSKKMIGNYTEEDLIGHPPDSLDVDVLIIHSYPSDLGKQAQVIKEKKNCKWFHVVHTISEELELYVKKASNPGKADSEKKPEHEVQLALCEAADIVIAIGPKVADAYKTALRQCEKQENVITMTPAIIDHQLLGVQYMCDGGEKFRVLISATYPSKYFEIKGCHIAAKAIKLLQDSSYHLTFVVLPDDDTGYLRHKLKGLISLNQLNIRPVSKSNEEWRKQLCQVDLVILPSAEGFGTSCVRAISAGVPVLSSGNSGFGMALKELPSGRIHILDSEDPQQWADKIRKLRDKGRTQLAREAKQLREEYMRQYGWKEQCDKLVDKMMEIVLCKEESRKVGVEHTEKITQAVTFSENRMQQIEIKSLYACNQEHGTADDVTKRVQGLDMADKNPDSRMGQENEECFEFEADKRHRPQQEEGIGVTKTSVEETGVTDQKSEFLEQENVAGDTVDAGTRSRFLFNFRDIPFSLESRVCKKLNLRDDVHFRDFRILGELMGFNRDTIESLAQERNPTSELFKLWCSSTRQATVGNLIGLLKHEVLQRMDVVEILEKWVEEKDSK